MSEVSRVDYMTLPYCAYVQYMLNPIALRKAKIVWNFGLSECNRVKHVMNINHLKGSINEAL